MEKEIPKLGLKKEPKSFEDMAECNKFYKESIIRVHRIGI
jgi:hypothetical protein